MYKILNKTIHFSLGLTFFVIVLGAYTRLKDAGLGCPDWPGCYGNLFAPSVSATFDSHAVAKAWIEMIHRYVAGTLGLLIMFIAFSSFRIRMQMPKLWLWTTLLVLLVVFQALLGMWTVTMLLNPLIVMSHLMGGFAIFAVLWWINLKLTNLPKIVVTNDIQRLTIASIFMLIVQIALGGWTSANYAALVCADFPTCQGQLLPMLDWKNAFALPGIPLENTARVTIQVAHRLGALITMLLCTALCIRCWQQRNKLLIILGSFLFSLLLIQICLGISNVLLGLPVWVSLLHSAVAVMILLCLLTIRYVIYDKHSTFK